MYAYIYIYIYIYIYTYTYIYIYILYIYIYIITTLIIIIIIIIIIGVQVVLRQQHRAKQFPHLPPERHGAGRLRFCVFAGFLCFSTLHQKFAGISPEFHRNFTGMLPECC